MINISSLIIAGAALVVASSAVEAASMNKCIVNGTVTYQQAPCASNQVRKEPTLEELNAAEKKRRAAAASAAAAAPAAAQAPTTVPAPAPAPAPAPTTTVAPSPAAASSRFSCDGRRYCSQMRSCEEAKYFLANCPGVKMDGDRNGIPCEKQWCSR